MRGEGNRGRARNIVPTDGIEEKSQTEYRLRIGNEPLEWCGALPGFDAA